MDHYLFEKSNTCQRHDFHDRYWKRRKEELHLQPNLEIGCIDGVWNRLKEKRFKPMGSVFFGVVGKGNMCNRLVSGEQ